jgi:hypothetical protein
MRLRVLDPAHALLPELGDAAITLDAKSFARVQPNVWRVFITEVNFLAFPPVKDSLLIFGAGYGFEVLAETAWLANCRVYYCGDIDTHGFAILDQLRAQLPHACSILMHRATLLAFETHWRVGEKQTLRDLHRLNADERALYDDLRDNRLRPQPAPGTGTHRFRLGRACPRCLGIVGLGLVSRPDNEALTIVERLAPQALSSPP